MSNASSHFLNYLLTSLFYFTTAHVHTFINCKCIMLKALFIHFSITSVKFICTLKNSRFLKRRNTPRVAYNIQKKKKTYSAVYFVCCVILPLSVFVSRCIYIWYVEYTLICALVHNIKVLFGSCDEFCVGCVTDMDSFP